VFMVSVLWHELFVQRKMTNFMSFSLLIISIWFQTGWQVNNMVMGLSRFTFLCALSVGQIVLLPFLICLLWKLWHCIEQSKMLKTRKIREAELAAQRVKRTKVRLQCTSLLLSFLKMCKSMLLIQLSYTKWFWRGAYASLPFPLLCNLICLFLLLINNV
jgi:hypothetical protein